MLELPAQRIQSLVMSFFFIPTYSGSHMTWTVLELLKEFKNVQTGQWHSSSFPHSSPHPTSLYWVGDFCVINSPFTVCMLTTTDTFSTDILTRQTVSLVSLHIFEYCRECGCGCYMLEISSQTRETQYFVPNFIMSPLLTIFNGFW